jgi:hypothetical protein
MKIISIIIIMEIAVALICNPTYSGSIDEDDQCQKLARANSSRPYLQNMQHKNGLVEWVKW